MSGEINEAPIVHGNVSCSSLHLHSLELLSSSTCVGVDTSLATSDNLVENKIVRSHLQTLVPREFNTRVVGDFFGSSPDSSLYSVHQTNTFDGVGVSLGGIDTSSGLGIQVPASGLYSSNFVFELSSDVTENVVQLGSNAYLEMTDPSNFQENGSFSVDFEWKGTSFDTDVPDGMVGSRVALVSTGGSGNYFGVFATKYDSEKYSLVAECSDGSQVLSLDLGHWQKDTWFHIIASWSSAQNTLSVQIDKSRFQTTGSFGNITSRPFYFGYDGTTTGGGFVYKYVRFHQDVLNAYSFENIPVVTSTDADGFRCEIVYSGGSVVVPSIAKIGTAVSTIPSTSGEVVVSLTTGPSAGPRRVVQSISLVPGGMKGNQVLNQTFVSAPGDIVRFESSQTIVTKEISVVGLKFDNMKVPVISLVSESVTVERGGVFADSGVSAVEIDANGVETDVSSAVTKTADPSTETVGEKYIFYTLTASDGLFTVRRCKKVNVVDTSVPVIVLTGPSEINHERGTVFVDQGATASDGSIILTSLIQVHNPVVIDVVGTYTITYDVIDARGNHAQQVTRKVNIIDTTPPIITVNPGSNGLIGQTVERLDAYTDPGATAVDQNGNEDITSSIQVSFVRNSDNTVLSEVDVATVGTYTVVYHCDDSAVNSGTANVATQKQRTVTVVDTTKPRIFINGPSNLTIERLGGYSDQGATAFDYSSAGERDTNNEYTAQIVTTNPVDHTTSGTYTVRYNVTDAHGNAADEVTRTVVVQDTTPPVITILGDNPFILERLDTYVDPGATALDGDTNYTSSIVVTNLVNNADAGTGTKEYSVHYDVQDITGNSATRKTRTVRVIDTTKPRLFLVGPSDVTVERLITYVDQGAAAFDFSSTGVQDNATNLTNQIVVTNPVDISTVGDYTVRFNVSDVSGNEADEITRTVRVRDTTAPIITITGSTTQVHERLNTYHDNGATAVDGNGGEDLTSRIQVANNVNSNATGDYTVVYSCTDDYGNSSSATRTVQVRDTIKPRITVNGPQSVTVEANTSYTDQGAVAYDYKENNQSSGESLTVTTDMGGFDATYAGTYTITYTASDAAGNAADPKTRTVTVETTASVTILGDNPVTVERLDTYTDAGATAIDVDGGVDLTGSIVVSGLPVTSGAAETSTTSQYWGNPSWYGSESKVLAYYDFTQTASWDSGTSTAVDLGPNNNNITYSADLGTVEYKTNTYTSANYLVTNSIRNDMVLTLGSTYTGTIAMGCWVKLFHGSDGYSASFPNVNNNWSGIMSYGTPDTNGHFFARGGMALFSQGAGNVAEYVYDFSIGCESVGQDTWSHSSIGSQKVWDYITAQPDYKNKWWCWQARLTATGRLETSLNGSPFALAQPAIGGEDLSTIDLINSNNSATLPQIRIGCDGHQDNPANHSYGAMFWYRDGEYTDAMALDFYNTFKDHFKPEGGGRVTGPVGNPIDYTISGYIRGVTISQDGTRMAVGYTDAHRVKIYELQGSTWTIMNGGDMYKPPVHPETDSRFGSAVSLSNDGNLIAIGATHYPNGWGTRQGRVFVYRWDGTIWTQLGDPITSPYNFSMLGASGALQVSGDGTSLFVGDTSYPGSGDDMYRGRIRHFLLSESGYVELPHIDSPVQTSGAEQRFGYQLDCTNDGKVVVASMPFYNSVDGAVVVYENTNTVSDPTWVLKGSIIDPPAEWPYNGKLLGQTGVAINGSDGSVIVISSTSANNFLVMEWNGSAWVQRGTYFEPQAIDNPQGGMFTHEGVDISDDGMLVAAGNTLDGEWIHGTKKGAARLWLWDGSIWNNIWTQQGSWDGEHYGFRVALSQSSVVAIGSNSTSVQVYEFEIDPVSSGTTLPVPSVEVTGPLGNPVNYTMTVGAIRGVTINQDGTRMAVGYSDDHRVKIYELQDSTWTIMNGGDMYKPPVHPETGSAFGSAVSMSNDGNLIAIGSNLWPYGWGRRQGRVHVYRWDGTIWTQLGDHITSPYDMSVLGQDGALKVSGDGTSLFVGDQSYPGSGNYMYQGRVRHFLLSEAGHVELPHIDSPVQTSGAEQKFGYRLECTNDGKIVVASMPFYNGNSGAVVVYENTNTVSDPTWVLKGSIIDAPAEWPLNDYSNGALFGLTGVTINGSDGSVIVISSGVANNIMVMEWNGSAWVQRGTYFEPHEVDNSTNANKYGHSAVDISDDGTLVAAGNTMDGLGGRTGFARLWLWNGSSFNNIWTQEGSFDGEFYGYSVALSPSAVVAVGLHSTSVQVYEISGGTASAVSSTPDEAVGGFDTSIVGDFPITYTVQDLNGIFTQATRTVQVRDTTAPEITVSNGDLTIARESTYVDAGATAFDKKSDGTNDDNTELTSSIVTTTKAKAPNGTNTWYVKVVNSGGNKYVFTVDSTFTSQGYLLYPEITLTAGETYVFDQSDSSNSNHPIRFADSSGGSYSTGVVASGTPGQAGATVTFTVPSYGYTTMKYVCQVHGAGMGNTIYVKAASDPVNTATAQKFQICYDVSDAEANAATTKYRMVTVSDSSSPSISLTGGTVTIERAVGSYSEPGYSASDGTVDLTSRVVVTNNVNISAHGDYYYHYDVSDSSGTQPRVSLVLSKSEILGRLL